MSPRVHELREADLVACGLAPDIAAAWVPALIACRAERGAAGCWQELIREKLTPEVPFAVHRQLFAWVYADRAEEDGPAPAWLPDDDALTAAPIAALMKAHGFSDVLALWRWSIAEPAAFWNEVIDRLGIVFVRRGPVLAPGQNPEAARWLPEATLNIVASCFQAPPETPAIVAGAPGEPETVLSYGALEALTAQVAQALRAWGFRPGDAIAIDMPMNVESVGIYLGIVSAGMAVVSIADSMAPGEVATRLRIAEAKALFTVGHVLRAGKPLALYEKVTHANPPPTVVLAAQGLTLRPDDMTWDAFLALAPAPTKLVVEPAAAAAPLNILFSSGTTGEPKAIPWTHVTPLKAAADAAYHLDVRPGSVVAWPTNLGWMMGPWLIFATLLNRATMALYADAPTGRDFGRFVQDARVNVLGLVPSIVKAWRADDRMIGFDWSALRCFGSTGEASNPEDYLYLMMLAHYRPVIEYCGGTEIGGGYITGTVALPAAPATFTMPALGTRFVLLDEEERETTNGEVYLVPPLLGASDRLLNRDHHEIYFAGTPRGPGGEPLRRHGDQLEALPGGAYRAHGRVDDTMNLGGIKVSSAEIERVLDGVPGVRRTAAVAVSPAGGGPSLLVIYAVAAPEQSPELLKPKLQDALKAELNPLFRIAELVLVEALPVTASNKIMRRELRARYASTPRG